jgi:hypothetical protein
MAQYSVGEALNKMINESKWKHQFINIHIKENWEAIAGVTIAKYTTEVKLLDDMLIVKTSVAALKYELTHSKQILIDKANDFLGSKIVKDLIIS